MSNSVDFNKTCLIAITGASRGIGRTIAIKIGRLVAPGSTLLLLSRDARDLNETKELIQNPDIKIVTKSIDLSRLDVDACKRLFSECDSPSYDLFAIFHNAGSTGDLSVSTDRVSETATWRDNFDLNVFNVALLNSLFLSAFEARGDRTLVVNITSLCGIRPFAGMMMYCTGKAAREMYFKVLAEERPDLKVLNYSPGPVQTAMFQGIIDNAVNPELKGSFADMQRENRVLTTEQTVDKMIKVIQEGAYKSGDHIDYFDRNE